MVIVLIRSNHISGVKVNVHAASAVDSEGVYTNLYTTDVVTSNQYNYHQHPLSTTLAASTLTFTPPMWLLLIASVVDSEC
jgi:hypothetical protein